MAQTKSTKTTQATAKKTTACGKSCGGRKTCSTKPATKSTKVCSKKSTTTSAKKTTTQKASGSKSTKACS